MPSRYLDPEQGKIGHRVRQRRVAMTFSQNFLVPHLQVQIALVISRGQIQMDMHERVPVVAIENVHRKVFSVDLRKALSRTTGPSSQKNHSSSKAESESSGHAQAYGIDADSLPGECR